MKSRSSIGSLKGIGEKTENLFHRLGVYKVEDLIRYYENNREGLVPYQSQDLELPDPPEGLEYRNMGTMENHVWSVIAKRMKHGHRSRSRREGTIWQRYWQKMQREAV